MAGFRGCHQDLCHLRVGEFVAEEFSIERFDLRWHIDVREQLRVEQLRGP